MKQLFVYFAIGVLGLVLFILLLSLLEWVLEKAIALGDWWRERRQIAPPKKPWRRRNTQQNIAALAAAKKEKERERKGENEGNLGSRSQ